MSPSGQDAVKALRELFMSLMSPGELKLFATDNFPAEVSQHVNWKGSRAEIADSFTTGLLSRGLLNDGLFEHLLRERPQRAGDIIKVYRQWLSAHSQTSANQKNPEDQNRVPQDRTRSCLATAAVTLTGMVLAGYLIAGLQPAPIKMAPASHVKALEVSVMTLQILGREAEGPDGVAFRSIIALLPKPELLKVKLSKLSLERIAGLVVTSPKGLAADEKNLREARKFLMEAAWNYQRALSFERIGIVIAGAYMLESEGGKDDAAAFYPRLNESLAAYGTPPAALEWIPVKGGSFKMGCPPRANCDSIEIGEEPATVGDFKILKHEVSMEMAKPFIQEKRQDSDWASRYIKTRTWNPRMPLIGVNWFEATALAYWLKGRLPTEKEWEYAARAGVSIEAGYGHDPDKIKQYEWVAGTMSSVQPICTSPGIRQFPEGFCDMHGNVFEWTSDWWLPYQSTESDPLSTDLLPVQCRPRALRGGSVIASPRESRSTSRDGSLPKNSGYAIGFRIVRDDKRGP